MGLGSESGGDLMRRLLAPPGIPDQGDDRKDENEEEGIELEDSQGYSSPQAHPQGSLLPQPHAKARASSPVRFVRTSSPSATQMPVWDDALENG